MYKWAQRINERPAVKKGVATPSESKIVNPAYEVRLKEEEGFADKEKELQDLRDKAKKQYEYVAPIILSCSTANAFAATSTPHLERWKAQVDKTSEGYDK